MPTLVIISNTEIAKDAWTILMIKIVLFKSSQFPVILIHAILPLKIFLLINITLDILKHNIIRYTFLLNNFCNFITIEIML